MNNTVVFHKDSDLPKSNRQDRPVFSTASKCVWSVLTKPDVLAVDDFYVVGCVELSNSGKTVKLYLYENGKRYFIGQILCKNLQELLGRSVLKVDITKYRNASKVETSDTAA